MHINSRPRITASTKVKKSFIPKTFSAIPSLLKKRSMSIRIQHIKAELAARTFLLHHRSHDPIDDGNVTIIKYFDELTCMPRPELCRVARELNQKLPQALRIEPLSHMQESTIRCRIEEMMGFRHLRRPAQNRVLSSHKRGTEPVSVDELSALLARHSQQGQRSPRSSFSSTSSRSSMPTSLDAVAESDEETGDRELWVDIIRAKMAISMVVYVKQIKFDIFVEVDGLDGFGLLYWIC
ncbi:hypothetical protein BU17DRAFT_69694 [Hysterangium stoloniferum]|nr:hypothetical protein BU17DRAFT_69694 [Hysterangium stoloniferum]